MFQFPLFITTVSEQDVHLCQDKGQNNTLFFTITTQSTTRRYDWNSSNNKEDVSPFICAIMDAVRRCLPHAQLNQRQHQPQLLTTSFQFKTANTGLDPTFKTEWDSYLDKNKETLWKNTCSVLADYAQKPRQQQVTSPAVCIGLGPCGLLFCVGYYLRGGSIMAFDKRDVPNYTRQNILRVSQPTYDLLLQIIGFDIMSYLFKVRSGTLTSALQPINFNQSEGDGLFDSNGLVRVIATNQFEYILYTYLHLITDKDKTKITLHPLVEVLTVDSNGLLVRHNKLNTQERIKLVRGSLVIAADGANSAIARQHIAYEEVLPTTLYATMTFDNKKDFPLKNASAIRQRGLIAIVDSGRNALLRDKVITPQESSAFVETYRRRNNRKTVRTILAYQDGKINKEKYYSLSSVKIIYQTDKSSYKNVELEVQCADRGRQDQLSVLKTMGWAQTQLPVSRFFSVDNIVYIGTQIPYRALQGAKKENLKRWCLQILHQHLPQDTIDCLKPTSGTVFSFAVKKALTYEQNVGILKLYPLGDALVTPHFLTGSGIYLAAKSVLFFLEYQNNLRHNDSNVCLQLYSGHIKTNVQDVIIQRAKKLTNIYPNDGLNDEHKSR